METVNYPFCKIITYFSFSPTHLHVHTWFIKRMLNLHHTLKLILSTYSPTIWVKSIKVHICLSKNVEPQKWIRDSVYWKFKELQIQYLNFSQEICISMRNVCLYKCQTIFSAKLKKKQVSFFALHERLCFFVFYIPNFTLLISFMVEGLDFFLQRTR